METLIIVFILVFVIYLLSKNSKSITEEATLTRARQTEDYQKLYEKAGGVGGSGYYANNKYEIYARLNGNNAIDLRLDFLDTHVADTGNSYPSGPWTGQDYVAGTLTAQIDVQRADDQDISGNGVVIPSPTFSHISEL